MTLPTLLRELAERLPERVRIDLNVAGPGLDIACVRIRGEWQTTWELRPDGVHDFRDGVSGELLEAALREECEARFWEWSTESMWIRTEPHARPFVRYRGRVLLVHSYSRRTPYSSDWTLNIRLPAEALALALLDALRATT